MHEFNHLSLLGRSTDEHIDKTIVKDLVFDEDAALAKLEAKADKKQRKAEQKMRDRIKAERMKTGNSNKDNADDDDVGEMIAQLAKGSRKNK
jgi:hypothetical protein